MLTVLPSGLKMCVLQISFPSIRSIWEHKARPKRFWLQTLIMLSAKKNENVNGIYGTDQKATMAVVKICTLNA